MPLKLITGPSVEPVTVEEMLPYATLDNDDDASILSMLIQAARRQAENLTRRAFITQTWDLYLDQFPSWEIRIPNPVLQSITSISYVDTAGDTQVLAADQYTIDLASEPARVTPAYGLLWPSSRSQINAVTIRFVAGYGGSASVPEGIRQWIYMRVATAMRNREEYRMDYGLALAQLPPSSIDGLLDPFRIDYFGPLNITS